MRKPHFELPPGADDEGRGRRAWGVRSTAFVALVGAIWFGALAVPGVGGLVLGAAVGAAAVVAGFVGLMGLGWLGFGLFALGDRLAAWAARRAGRWPDAAGPG